MKSGSERACKYSESARTRIKTFAAENGIAASPGGVSNCVRHNGPLLCASARAILVYSFAPCEPHRPLEAFTDSEHEISHLSSTSRFSFSSSRARTINNLYSREDKFHRVDKRYIYMQVQRKYALSLSLPAKRIFTCHNAVCIDFLFPLSPSPAFSLGV